MAAKAAATILLDECNRLYDGRPGDDTTVCAIKVRSRNAVNLLVGPPQNPEDDSKMMALFFAKEGKHIVCGGTSASIAAVFLHKELLADGGCVESDVPPTALLDGVDLVTEGVVTINRVLEYARDHLEANNLYFAWGYGRDGASRMARLLFEEATDINFYVGRAVNPAHQSPNSAIEFTVKMRLVEELAACLKRMGKRVKVSHF